MDKFLEEIKESILVEMAKKFMLIIKNENPDLYKQTLNKAAEQSGTHIRWNEDKKEKRK